jgi:hypothetical protein
MNHCSDKKGIWAMAVWPMFSFLALVKSISPTSTTSAKNAQKYLTRFKKY